MPIGGDAGDSAPAVAREAAGLSPAGFAEVVRAGQPLVGVVWSVWRTAEDERVCPTCGPLDGARWPEGEGPVPPLHRGCRCAREVDGVEWGSRG